MDYLKLIVAFDRWCEINPLSTNTQIIWYKLCSINNKCMWAEWFRVTNQRLMYLTGISNEPALIKNREKLIQQGLISYKKGKKGKPSQYHIKQLYATATKNSKNISENVSENISENVSENISENVSENISENVSENISENVSENISENVSHNKHKTQNIKHKTKEKNIIKKEKVAEFVELTNDEHKKLITQYGEKGTKRLIEILDNYKGSCGKTYKSDYRAILNWVVKKVQEEEPGTLTITTKDDPFPF